MQAMEIIRLVLSLILFIVIKGGCTDKVLDRRKEYSSCNITANGSLICRNCKTGYYGRFCEVPCSHSCWNNICNRQNGICLYGCNPGFYGSFCEGCVAGKYGINCSIYCPFTCNEGWCEQITGNCLSGCVPSMFGPKCENTCQENCDQCYSSTLCVKCIEGYFGGLCNSTCPEGCRSDCYQDGTCADCKDACDLPCPANCFRGLCNRTGVCYSCINGFYGDQCEHKCPLGCCNCTCFQNGSWKQWDSERIGLVTSVCVQAMVICLFISYTVIQRRRRANEKRTCTRPENDTEQQMITFPDRLEEGQNQLNAIHEVHRSESSSNVQNMEDGNEDISSHVYSGPYERPSQPGQYENVAKRPIYAAPAVGLQGASASGSGSADREVQTYEPLTSERRPGNYSALTEL